jgi:peroxiredoxin (alkyl hydroperoxide reductase subunit C)
MSTEPTSALPRLNEPAPQFTAPSTQGEIRLSDYKGKWVVLFSHPADFTPVCTTEFVAFARAAATWEELDVQLIGLSIDSVYSHIAWIRSIEAHFGVSIGFPLIADLGMKVANLYGMIHPGASQTAAVRAVFVIDPGQNIRAMIYYPMTAGRLVDEIIRLVQALRVNTERGLATPEGWHPGEACIIPPPTTLAEAAERLRSDHDVIDWYLARTKAAAREGKER